MFKVSIADDLGDSLPLPEVKEEIGMTWNPLHEQYESDGKIVLFRCSECGYVSLSLGKLHSHIEKHRGYTPLGIQIPFTKTSPGDFGQLMEFTEVLMVEKSKEIELSEVDGL